MDTLEEETAEEEGTAEPVADALATDAATAASLPPAYGAFPEDGDDATYGCACDAPRAEEVASFWSTSRIEDSGEAKLLFEPERRGWLSGLGVAPFLHREVFSDGSHFDFLRST